VKIAKYGNQTRPHTSDYGPILLATYFWNEYVLFVAQREDLQCRADAMSNAAYWGEAICGKNDHVTEWGGQKKRVVHAIYRKFLALATVWFDFNLWRRES
jgi:hypothetical protein